jgi:hypothetical protein
VLSELLESILLELLESILLELLEELEEVELVDSLKLDSEVELLELEELIDELL